VGGGVGEGGRGGGGRGGGAGREVGVVAAGGGWRGASVGGWGGGRENGDSKRVAGGKVRTVAALCEKKQSMWEVIARDAQKVLLSTIRRFCPLFLRDAYARTFRRDDKKKEHEGIRNQGVGR